MHLSRRSTLAVGFLLAASALGRAEAGACLSLDRLQRMTPCELKALFETADVGTPLVGCAKGRILYRNDKHFAKLKVRLSNTAWKGKAANADGSFVNLWVGHVRAIGSHYVVGPSWLDGRPAAVVEYPAGTPLLANMRDELREVAPGLYMGPIYDRFPCPKFKGFLAVQVAQSPGTAVPGLSPAGCLP